MRESEFYREERSLAEADILRLRPEPEKLLYNFLVYIAGITTLLVFYILLWGG